MGHWNHRIVRVVHRAEDYPEHMRAHVSAENVEHALAEVHYDDDGKPYGYGSVCLSTYSDDGGDPMENLRLIVHRLAAALRKPVVEFGVAVKLTTAVVNMEDRDAD